MSHVGSGMRDHWGQALVRMGEKYPNIVVLDADVAHATRANLFETQYPERFLQFGCAEQNLISAAAGVASMGLIPVTSIFACFCSRRAADQVSISVAMTRLNVKICASYAGLTTPNTGATHQSVDDINIVRGMPNMTVIEAADAVELEMALDACIQHVGPTYLRIVRCACERVVPDDYRFQIGKACLLRSGDDITLIGSGLMVGACVQAAKVLDGKGMSAEVINISTIKPIDVEAIIATANKTGCVLTAENHSIIGGLGSAVAEVLSEHCPVPLRRVGINDRFGTSGHLDTILQSYGLTAENIALQAEAHVKKQSAGHS